MKKLMTIIMLMTLYCIGMNAQKTYVLLSGVSNYGDPSINLYNTTKDVKQMKKIWSNQKNTLVAIVTSKYANHDNLISKLNSIVQLAKPEDNVIFYFSGHGNVGGIFTSDGTMFRYQEIVNILKQAKAQNVICFIDACMSGSVKDISQNNYGIGADYPKITFVTASDGNEYSVENNWVGNGFFTKALLKGLRGKSDKNKDKRVTLIELFNYIYNDVTARTKNYKERQHPQLVGPGSMHNLIITKW